jgi:hypothetical protein
MCLPYVFFILLRIQKQNEWIILTIQSFKFHMIYYLNGYRKDIWNIKMEMEYFIRKMIYHFVMC